MRRIWIGPAMIAAAAWIVPAVSAQELETEKDKTSYSVGIQLGQMLKVGGDMLDDELVIQGLRDQLEGKESKVDEQTRQQLLAKWQTQAQEAAAAAQIGPGREFLEANAKKEGVVTLPSGLQYEVLEEGSGDSPGPTDKVKAHYRGTLIDGTQFDSSYDRNEPFVAPVTGVIRGWTEALQLMKEGSKWKIYVPYDLAYGPQGRPPVIPPYSTLIFEMELLEVNPEGGQ